MLRPRLSIALAALLVLSAVVMIYGTRGYAYKSAAQDDEKSLDIERYPNEPLEIVDIRIGEQSVKDKVSTKSRRNGVGLDSVKFKEKNGWFKRIRVRLRNVSGQSIYGLRAYLYFKPPTAQNLFSLPLVRFREKKGGPLQPGDEIELLVNDQVWNPTADLFNQYGANPDAATVTLSVESVTFGDDIQWNRGHMLRRDPSYPNKWKAVDAEPPPRISKLWPSVRFITAAFAPRASPQSAYCEAYGGFFGDNCSVSGCYRKREIARGRARARCRASLSLAPANNSTPI